MTKLPLNRRSYPHRAACFVLLALSSGFHAQAAGPAKKDDSARMKPKDVIVSAAVAPIEAKPGETLTFKVTAKLNPGWHIYIYSKQEQSEGPKNTKFDFFETAGLVVDGDWTASKTPIRKKEPAFPDLDSVSFFEDEVTWSLNLKVPADAMAGKKILRCQASYQICNAQSCSFPGKWTLPDVELTILPPGSQASVKPASGAIAAAALKPDHADSSEKARPPGLVMTPDVEPARAKAGETVTYRIKTKIPSGWHIYDFAKVQPADGPKVTQFDFFDPAGLAIEGDWTSDRAPELKADASFPNQLVAFFENEVTWSIKLKVPADAVAGLKTLLCQAAYQICDATSCRPPGQWTLPAVVLTVVPGNAEIAAAGVTSKPVENVSTPAPVKSAVVEKTERPRVVSDVEKKAQQGVLPLMIASALAGLLALVMPCVWPMIPITVNFFVKQGQKKNGSPTGLAITYCLAIIGIFTSVGVLCSFFLSASALPKLANSPWLNFFVAGLFFVFGLSLLGLFEISLPTSFLNASAKGEGRGGLVGVFFMALTLTITSFTCTFPVVGGLLVMASTGQFFYPIIGLATFATVLALPFFLLALSPGMLSKVPKSGDWMNSVKVVGGLIEIGAALKFLNTAELSFVTPENAWIDAQFILTAWTILAAVCGFYLLGFFRTDHDYEEVKVGAGRILLGSSFLGAALFLAPALFGRPPQSPIWDRLVVGLLPPDVSELSRSSAGGGEGAGANAPLLVEKHATDTDPKVAERQEKRFHGVWWGFSYEEALERAKTENKPILIDFTGLNCANCRVMEATVLPRPEVVSVLNQFVTVQLYTAPRVPIASITNEEREALANQNGERQIDLTSDNTNPFYVVLSPEGKVLGAIGGLRERDVFIAFLTEAMGRLKGAKVAQVP